MPRRPGVCTTSSIDTSRNGRAPGPRSRGKYSGDPKTWCNAPGRGIGARPTAATGVPLVDAYLWIKIPASPTASARATSGGTIDPEYGIVDPRPVCGGREQAKSLVRNADPALEFNTVLR